LGLNTGKDLAAYQPAFKHGLELLGVIFSAEGFPFAFFREGYGPLHVINPVTGETSCVLPEGQCGSWVAVSQDFTMLLSERGFGEVHISSLPGGRYLYLLAGMPDAAFSAAFHPTRRYIAVGLQANDVYLWDLKDRKLVCRLGDDGQTVGTVAFSHDGSLIAAASGNQVRLWRLADVLGK
jgi:WD40 repeat protein